MWIKVGKYLGVLGFLLTWFVGFENYQSSAASLHTSATSHPHPQDLLNQAAATQKAGWAAEQKHNTRTSW